MSRAAQPEGRRGLTRLAPVPDSHGLPAALHEWLFPQDGSRRDFETLQVILGPREGEFFASDRHGKRDQKPTETAAPQQQQQSPLAGRLRRASTLWQQQQQRDPATHKRLSFIEDPEAQQPPAAAAAANKRLSFIGDPAAEAKGNRRRSATLSSLGWASSSRRTLSLPKVPLDPAEPEDQRRARRTTLLPLALQAGGPAPFTNSSNSNSSINNINREAAATTATATATTTAAASASRRSTSPPSRGPSRAGSLRAAASNHSLNSVASRESAGNFSPERRRTPPRASIPEEEPPLPNPPRRPVSVYADACIQTDPVPEDDDALSDYQHQPHHYDDGGFGGAARRARGMSTASEASTVFSRAATDTSSRRTSMASDIKIDPAAAAAAPCWVEQRHQEQQQQQQQEEQLYQQQQQWVANNFNPNPIVMGRMQDYFRSPAYCLGDAFRPTLGSGMYWGSWRQ